MGGPFFFRRRSGSRGFPDPPAAELEHEMTSDTNLPDDPSLLLALVEKAVPILAGALRDLSAADAVRIKSAARALDDAAERWLSIKEDEFAGLRGVFSTIGSPQPEISGGGAAEETSEAIRKRIEEGETALMKEWAVMAEQGPVVEDEEDFSVPPSPARDRNGILRPTSPHGR